MPEYSTEGLQETRGKWITYKQGGDATELVQSLEGHPLEWCIADLTTAQNYLDGGDMHLYYSINEAGEAIVPRLAIRMQGEHIGEIRGIAHDQNFDPHIAPKLDEKLKDFGPEADKYKKKSADMKRLTDIERKAGEGETLPREDLIFLYEIESKIEGFGYDRDPRIKEIQAKRNQKDDLPVLFDCTPAQIAYEPSAITSETVAYIGPWNPEVYAKFPPSIKHAYERFPDQSIFLKTVEGDPTITNAEEAKRALKAKGFEVGDYAKDMLAKTEFTGTQEQYNLVSFSVESLGFPNGATTDEIYTRAAELGFELVPAEAGVYLRLQYSDQPMGEYLYMAMKQITDRGDDPRVWSVSADGGRRWLSYGYASPDSRWSAGSRLVFRSRKLDA
ncbi:MAG: hypothetical protein WC764_00770 [Candidatus Paceibacterota bacterium]|jgi:hypothetical protein